MTRPDIGQPHLFEPPPAVTLTLRDRFLVPPFSVLDARAGYWQDRKRDWLRLGIQGELGRSEQLEEKALFGSDADLRQRWEGSAYPRGRKARELALLAELETGDAVRSSQQGRADGLTYNAGTEEDTYYRRERERALAQLQEMYDCTPEEAQKRWEAEEATRARRGGPLMDSSLGRGDRLLSGATPRAGYGGDYDLSKGENAWGGKGTSVFDPVLCELAYRWFSPEGGLVADPFAGGSVRGIVAAALGRRYVGTDLSLQQMEANELQVPPIRAAVESWQHDPRWHHADARHFGQYVEEGTADLIFTCPPYYDLEVYSDDPQDLSSAGTYQEFLVGYRECIAAAATALHDDRFAIFVVGEVRDKRTGRYVGLVPDTIAACEAAGLGYYNEGILVTSVGSLPIRTSRLFGPGRKLGKSHQNVLVFIKGSWKAACEACGLPEEVAVEYGGATWRTDGVVQVEETGEELDLYDTSTPAF